MTVALVVDDDSDILESLTFYLQTRSDLTVLTATSAEALLVLARHDRWHRVAAD